MSQVSELIGGTLRPAAEGVDGGGGGNVLTKEKHSPGWAYRSNTALMQVEKAWERRK